MSLPRIHESKKLINGKLHKRQIGPTPQIREFDSKVHPTVHSWTKTITLILISALDRWDIAVSKVVEITAKGKNPVATACGSDRRSSGPAKKKPRSLSLAVLTRYALMMLFL